MVARSIKDWKSSALDRVETEHRIGSRAAIRG